MRELIVRMTVTDDDAATALRVIAHFDALVEHGASTAAIVRATAALSGTVAGWRDGERTTRIAPTGATLLEPGPPVDPAWPRVVLDRSGTSAVWLEPSDDDGPLDRLIVERCAQALRAKLPGGGRSASREELTRLACESEATDRERADALVALGLGGPVLVAVTGVSVVPLGALRCLMADQWIALAAGDADPTTMAPVGARVGSCLVDDGDLPSGVRRARRALALAVAPACGGPAHVRFEELGALATIAAAVPEETARADPDVVQLEALRARRPWVPATLRAVTIEPSLRQAAVALHLHHSSLNARLRWLADELGYQVTDPSGRERAAAAWAMWRVSGLLHETT